MEIIQKERWQHCVEKMEMNCWHCGHELIWGGDHDDATLCGGNGNER